MGIADDLSADALADVLRGRPVRSYPAVVSTEAAALAWARKGAPHGAVVVAGYQASPRGRAGLPWELSDDASLGFSLVLRPELSQAREGWVYAAAIVGLAHVMGDGAVISWPDEVLLSGSRAGAIGAWVELGPGGVRWAVVNIGIPETSKPRPHLLADVADAIDERMRAEATAVLDDYRPRCQTLGRQVRARMIPMGPAGPRVEGTAVDLLSDGSLVLRTARGNRVAVRPQNLGLLDDLEGNGGGDGLDPLVSGYPGENPGLEPR